MRVGVDFSGEDSLAKLFKDISLESPVLIGTGAQISGIRNLLFRPNRSDWTFCRGNSISTGFWVLFHIFRRPFFPTWGFGRGLLLSASWAKGLPPISPSGTGPKILGGDSALGVSPHIVPWVLARVLTSGGGVHKAPLGPFCPLGAPEKEVVSAAPCGGSPRMWRK